MTVIKEITENNSKYMSWRKQLHSIPELAYKENETSDFIAEKLKSFGIPIVRGLGKTGLVGTIRSGNSDRSIGLRADMDALPINELNTFKHKSKHSGVMHACGHDGHSATLLAAAEYLSTNRNFDGTVHLIFQPAEEGEAGAKAMIDDGLFQDFPMESVYAIHNWPGLPIGEIAMRSGPIMAAMDVFEIKIIGKGGHAALPHLVIDPIPVGAQVILALQNIVSRNLSPTDTAVVSVTQFHAGDAWAVVPKEIVLKGTVRSFTPRVQKLIEQRMKEITSGICTANNCDFNWWYEKRFPPTVNSSAETELAAKAARSVCGNESVNANVEMVTGSEDFGYMLQEKPGCYAFLGNGPGEGGCMLHSAHYDFNDEIIPVGASYFVQLVAEELKI
jgi:hippurate hydrolase